MVSPFRTARLVACLAALAVAGGLCTVSALDRINERRSTTTRFWLGADAAGRVALNRTRDEDLDGALAAARAYVRTDPLDPDATAVLATILVEQSAFAEADAAFRVAGQLGWRNVPTQLYWLSQSLAADDIDNARLRLDAILRLRVNNPLVASGLLQMEQTEAGTEALIELLQNDPPWQDRFVRGVSQLPDEPMQQRINLLVAARRAGAPINCTSVAAPVTTLLNKSKSAAARQLWDGTCGQPGKGLVRNGDFESTDQESASPFAWTFFAEGGVDASITAAPAPLSGQALTVQSTLPREVQIVAKLLDLEPGSYRLAWQSVDENGERDDGFRVGILCNQSRQVLIDPGSSVTRTGRTSAVQFSVPENCIVQRLTIHRVAGGLGSGGRGWMDDLSITRTGAAS
ncbi:tetratricopeptide repeat protein [Sphingomonas sp. CJ99]